MTGEELAGVREFLATLPQKRQQVSDGALLDQCQEWLGKLIGHIDDTEPRRFADEEKAAQTLSDTGHSGQGRKLASNIDEPHYPEPAHIEDVPRDEPVIHHHMEPETPKPKVTRKHPHKR